ncbi:MAG: PaaI family thioesterase [Anaerolineales bacterium]|nr:MAG: PaaI family thioesterase [Anaerolineales bacterium]
MMSTSPPPHDRDHAIKQPNSNHCFVCGLENGNGLGMMFYEQGPGSVMATYEVPDHFQGYPGVVHGGIVAAMLDEVAGRAAMVGKHDHFRYTVKLEIKYRQPTPTGTPLKVHGWVEKERGSRAIAKAELRLEDGTLLAQAEALLADLPGNIREDQLAALGWRVYPD